VKPILVNLGCGSRFHPDWVNLDLHSAHPGVQPCDLSRGVPLADNSCDGVFNSALLEHLQPEDAARFLRECHRVLKPGGIFRLGVPDLESIARMYLRQLERAVAGEPGADHDYDWMVLEMIDQLVRARSGGRIAEFVLSVPKPAFIAARIGDEYSDLLAALRLGRINLWTRFRQLPPALRRHKARNWLIGLPGRVRRFLVGLFLSAGDRAALSEGRFRRSGEVHQWMYDRYSLARLLRACGFEEIKVLPAGESAIPLWPGYGLDQKATREPVKPDLVYLECRKPA
jgi:SAM-dependent methyltransferase